MPALDLAVLRILDLDPGRMPFIGIIRRILFLRYDPFEVSFAGFMEQPNAPHHQWSMLRTWNQE